METDLVDGLMLIELLEKLASPKTVGRYSKNPKQKLQMIENLGTALQFIYNQKIKLVNIGKCLSTTCSNIIAIMDLSS